MESFEEMKVHKGEKDTHQNSVWCLAFALYDRYHTTCQPSSPAPQIIVLYCVLIISHKKNNWKDF